MRQAAEWTPDGVADALAQKAVTSVMNPARLGSVSPALLTGHVWSSVQLTMTGNFQVDDSNIGASTARVSTQDNVIIYAPTQGWDDMVLRYGRVPTGVVINENTFGFIAWAVPITINPVIGSLTFTGPMIVPYSNFNPKDQVVITPQLDRNWSYTNPYNGVVLINSTEEALTNVVVSGRMTAVALASDIGPQRRENGAFDPIDLNSISLTSKDDQSDIPMKEGVALLQGPDVAPTFRPVAQLQEDLNKKLWLPGDQGDYDVDRGFYDGTLGQRTVNTLQIAIDQDGRNELMGSWWISPHQINAAFTYVGQNIITPPIGLQDTFDVEIWTAPGYVSTSTASATVRYSVEYTSYFATCSSNHEILITSEFASEELYTQGLRQPAGVTFSAYSPTLAYVKKTLSARPFQGPQKTRGIFLGMNVNICVQQQSGFVAGPANPADLTFRFDPIRPTRFRIAAHEGSDMSTIGPIRACAMESVSNGSVISVQGRFNVQCLGRDDTYELIRDTSTESREAVSVNFNLFLRMAFKSSSNIFKRVYRRSEYLQIISRFFSGKASQDGDSLLDATGGDEKLIAAGRAAGLFSGLGSVTGGLLGSLFGNSDVGSTIGRTIGSLGDAAMESLGEMAGGGAAAGSFTVRQPGYGSVSFRRQRQ